MEGPAGQDAPIVGEGQDLVLHALTGLDRQVDRPGDVLINPAAGRHPRDGSLVELDERIGIGTGQQQYQPAAQHSRPARPAQRLMRHFRRCFQAVPGGCRVLGVAAPLAFIPQRQDAPGGKNDQGGVDRQLIAHGGVELQRLPDKVDRRPAPDQRMREPFLAVFVPLGQQAPAHPQEPGPGQQPQRQPQSPDDHVLQRKPHWPARPLHRRREIHIPAGLCALLGDVLHPLWIGLKAKEPRPAKGVRLEQAEHHQADHGCQQQVSHQACERALAPVFVHPRQVDQHSQRQGRSHRGRVQLGGHGHAQCHAEPEAEPYQPASRPAHGNQHRQVKCQHGEEGGEGVHGKEMGLLDLQHHPG